MDLSTLVTVSCFATGISMVVLIIGLVLLLRFGQQGLTTLVDRLLGRNDNAAQSVPDAKDHQRPRPAVASSQSLRQRARDLDFPAPAHTQAASASFGAQAAAPISDQQMAFPPNPQQASLRPRGQYPDFNPQAQASEQGLQMTMPSLSPSRPFQQGTQFRPAQAPQPNQFTQQQAPQANTFNRQAMPQQPQASNNRVQPLQGRPLQGQSPNIPPMPPAQGNPLSAPQPPMSQSGLGQNRPPLRSRPRPTDTAPGRGIGGRDKRYHDDYDRVYDDGGGDFGDQIGDILDNF